MSEIKKADMNFLVVDDFPTMRRIIRGLLEEAGYTQADEAEDGAVGRALMTSKKAENGKGYDFVITDINMPNMNGFDLLDATRKSGDTVPILMVTAEALKEDILRAAQSGADGYIVKPFTGVTLQEKIERISAKHGITFVDAPLTGAPTGNFNRIKTHLGHYRNPEGQIVCVAAPQDKGIPIQELQHLGTAVSNHFRELDGTTKDITSLEGRAAVVFTLPHHRAPPTAFACRVKPPTAA